MAKAYTTISYHSGDRASIQIEGPMAHHYASRHDFSRIQALVAFDVIIKKVEEATWPDYDQETGDEARRDLAQSILRNYAKDDRDRLDLIVNKLTEMQRLASCPPIVSRYVYMNTNLPMNQRFIAGKGERQELRFFYYFPLAGRMFGPPYSSEKEAEDSWPKFFWSARILPSYNRIKTLSIEEIQQEPEYSETIYLK